MAKARTYRKKYSDLQNLQQRYFDYLTGNEEPVKIETHLKLVQEINRIAIQLKHLENLNLLQLQSPVSEWELKMSSSLNKIK